VQVRRRRSQPLRRSPEEHLAKGSTLRKA